MKVGIFTLGCKTNQYESEAIIEELNNRGFITTTNVEWADKYIINTCSITMEADKKSRQMISKLMKQNPFAKVLIMGCSSENNSDSYKGKDGVVAISGVADKINTAVDFASDIFVGERIKPLPTAYEDDMTAHKCHTRAFIKIQDGCDNFCSYCIVPYLRGRSRSRSLTSIISEAKEKSAVTREIVITGINISDYGSDIGLNLIDLVKAMGEIDSRKRLGSIEPRIITRELLIAMKESNFCDFFHLSLQSLNDKVLAKMNRHYKQADIFEKVALIREHFPNCGISADIITGFPEESDEDHRDTLEALRKLQLSDFHIFPYSVREGTKAEKMEQVTDQVVAVRESELNAVKTSSHDAFVNSMLDTTMDVYFEGKKSPLVLGHTSNFLKVYAKAPNYSYRQVQILAPYKDGVKGLLIGKQIIYD